jgi:3-hydroxyacyl-CoA dehydrogenase / 3-hydroxy-2-methylbutyryl-CoA dehydrogenase
LTASFSSSAMMMIRRAPTALLSRGSFRTAGQQQARRDRLGLVVAHHPHPPPASFDVRAFTSGRTSEAPGADAISENKSTVVAMVAGGASGLGAAAAKALLQRGARVVVADLNRSAFDSDPDFARYRDSDQPQVLAFREADVTSPDQVSSALDAAEAAFGRTINASVCCAGIATARRTIGKSGSAHSLDEFARVLHVNTLGTFNVARLSAERMVRGVENETSETNGCIVLTSSIAAYEGQVGQVAYAASKAAVVGMTLPLARDLAQHKIRVVTIVRMHSFGLFAL